MNKNTFLVSLAISIIILIASIFYFGNYIYNATPSFPIGLYKINKNDKTIKRSKLILICPPATKLFYKANSKGYVSKGYCSSGLKPLIKKIAATSKDYISISKFVYINGIKQPKSNVYKKDSQGNSLKFSDKKNYYLKRNEIFLLSDYNERSFDSRYFGPIDKSLIIGTIEPVLVW